MCTKQKTASQMLGMNQAELTNYLWANYHPYNFWIVVTGIGMLTTLSLFAYDRILRPKKG